MSRILLAGEFLDRDIGEIRIAEMLRAIGKETPHDLGDVVDRRSRSGTGWLNIRCLSSMFSI